MVFSGAISESSTVEIGLVLALCSIIFAAATTIAVQRFKVVALEKLVEVLQTGFSRHEDRIDAVEKWQIEKDAEARGRRSERKRRRTDKHETIAGMDTREWESTGQG